MPVPAPPVRLFRALTIAVLVATGIACSSTSDSSSGTEPKDPDRTGTAGAEPAEVDDGIVTRNQSAGLKQLSGDAVRTPAPSDD